MTSSLSNEERLRNLQYTGQVKALPDANGRVLETGKGAIEPINKPAREWMPRLWQGCDLFAWLRLVSRNRCAIQPSYLYIAGIATAVSFCHTVLRYVQDQWFGSKIEKTVIKDAPIFIIGHWRTGTTLLHELLILDERHNFPNTFQCLAPNSFLLTERVFSRSFRFLLPSRRQIDNMALGWDKPQEEEFALCMLGQPSPYLTIAFPNRAPQDMEAFDPERLRPRQREAWKQGFLRFLRQLTFKDGRRLVLKSPTHSCRIPTLLKMFPDARFVHIVRDPYTVFLSTVNLWKTLYRTHGLQTPTFAGLEEQVFTTFNYLYDRIEVGKKLVRPDRFHEMKFEDLTREPAAAMRKLYDGLGLGGFENVKPRFEEYFRLRADYQPNKFPPLDSKLREEIGRRWAKVIQRYGYE